MTTFSQWDQSQLFSLTEVALVAMWGILEIRGKFSISHQLLFYLLKPGLGVWEGMPQTGGQSLPLLHVTVKTDKLLAKYTISVEAIQ